MRGRLRVTEQGETVTARYAQPEIAERDLELTVGAVLARPASAPGRRDSDDERHLAHAADAARRAYLALTADEDRLARYTRRGDADRGRRAPADRLAAGVARGGKLTLESLRAIPWVFSWTQSRHGIPGWFGVGTALEALAAEYRRRRIRACKKPMAGGLGRRSSGGRAR